MFCTDLKHFLHWFVISGLIWNFFAQFEILAPIFNIFAPIWNPLSFPYL